jgi:hypothetical protein
MLIKCMVYAYKVYDLGLYFINCFNAFNKSGPAIFTNKANITIFSICFNTIVMFFTNATIKLFFNHYIYLIKT